MSKPVDWSLLLERSTRAPEHSTAALTDMRVLITGAGGTIGTALAEHVARSSPARLVLLDTAEHALYTLDRDISARHTSVLGSVTDARLLEALFREHRPEIVLHTAAHKHVTIVERNPFAGIANNALGTATLAEAAFRHGAEQLVFVSTDKAVDPVSMMGASKRIAELALLSSVTAVTRVKIVRLANVLGSRGSVVPLFLDQLRADLPFTVAGPDVRRYFITIDECVHALTQALTCEENLLTVYAGEPIAITDLARFLSSQAGRPDHPIRYTGLGPADRKDESLISQCETWAWPEWSSQSLRAIRSPVPMASEMAGALEALRVAVSDHDLPLLLATVRAIIPDYRPSGLLAETKHA